MMNIDKIRADFPALGERIYNGIPLVYLDNAATTQRPTQVVERMNEAYYRRNANIHRGVHFLSQKATEAHEEARTYVANFINARESAEVLFVRGTTEGINLIASTFCPAFMKEGDEVIISEMEHHSNIVPWQMAETRMGIKLKVVPIHDNGELDLDAYRAAFSDKTKLVSICFASNVLGTVNPIKDIVKEAHKHDVPVMIDAAQAIAHRQIDVQDLDVDFLAFSAHKAYGPTGVGVLYGKREWLDKLPPYQGGGEMIEHVSFAGTTFNELPFKFEAGTPDFLGSVGLMEGLRYIENIGFDALQAHEKALLEYATEELQKISGLKIYGTAAEKEAVISFLIDGIHPYDLGVLLDRQGIAIRTGHHCAQPLMERYGIDGTARVSFAVYNTKEEVDFLIKALHRAIPMLQ
ncbi:cysteine desulfurase [Porphyromonadaceae bacterium W3.11]|nr:cysteine desulfurase [Porphyromonadaceae bacterium W3.11]